VRDVAGDDVQFFFVVDALAHVVDGAAVRGVLLPQLRTVGVIVDTEANCNKKVDDYDL
jgi:hypothetical protein